MSNRCARAEARGDGCLRDSRTVGSGGMPAVIGDVPEAPDFPARLSITLKLRVVPALRVIDRSVPIVRAPRRRRAAEGSDIRRLRQAREVAWVAVGVDAKER